MNLGTPEGCREEADRLVALAAIAGLLGDVRKAEKIMERSRELRLLTAKLERDEAKAPSL